MYHSGKFSVIFLRDFSDVVTLKVLHLCVIYWAYKLLRLLAYKNLNDIDKKNTQQQQQQQCLKKVTV